MKNELKTDIRKKRTRTTNNVSTASQSDSMAVKTSPLVLLRAERIMRLIQGDNSEKNRRAAQEDMYLGYAPDAYEAYLECGRGSLVAFLITWLGEPEMHVLYLPLTAEQFTLPEFGGVKKLVESYDPQNEIVGIMHVPSSETRFEFVFSKDDISPGELHKQYGDIL